MTFTVACLLALIAIVRIEAFETLSHYRRAKC